MSRFKQDYQVSCGAICHHDDASRKLDSNQWEYNTCMIIKYSKPAASVPYRYLGSWGFLKETVSCWCSIDLPTDSTIMNSQQDLIIALEHVDIRTVSGPSEYYLYSYG
jgi:hypothetical protein